jgi:hypothetical protein
MSLEKQVMSDEFRSRLSRVPDNNRVGVIIFGVRQEMPSDLPTAKKRIRAAELGRESVKPIVKYLKEQGAEANGNGTLGVVYSHLTPPQIYALAEQDYVRAIIENQGAELIE